MKKIRDIIVLVVVAIPLVIFAVINSLLLFVTDLTGVMNLLHDFKIKRRFMPASRTVSPDVMHLREEKIMAAFNANGYHADGDGVKSQIRNGVIGIRTTHRTAFNHQTGQAKLAYYTEGTPFEMGRFIGYLGEPDVEKMSIYYVDHVVLDFMGVKKASGVIGTIIADLVYRISRWNDAVIPEDLIAEIYGIWAGAREINPKTKVRIRDLYVLNYGVDVLISYVYAGIEPILKLLGINIHDFKPQFGCNAFTIRDELVKDGGLLFGRDFMFPSCGVFRDVASYGITKPVSDGIWYEHTCPANASKFQHMLHSYKRKHSRHFHASRSRKHGLPHTLLQVFAPGMVGSVVALNEHGVAMGLDMVAARHCNWRKVGLNSLALARYAVSWAANKEELFDLVEQAPRGVSWLYPVADGNAVGDGSCAGAVIEALMKKSNNNWLAYVNKNLKKILPNQQFIASHSSTDDRTGMFVRKDDYSYPKAYLDFNQPLFDYFQKKFPDEQAWGETGCLNESFKKEDLPCGYYFSPQREKRTKMMIAGNHFIVPEARLSAMNEWTSLVPALSHSFDDFQWRYDRLNLLLTKTIASDELNMALDFDTAWNIINFLRPYEADGSKAAYWEYYALRNNQVRLPQDVPVEGSISLIDCTRLQMRSLWGMYCDQTVSIDFAAMLKAML